METILFCANFNSNKVRYLISGRFRFSGDEGDFIVEPGCSWNFKGGLVHGAEVLEDSVAVEIFSPIRQDYLA
jgi:quercetin dioxygenase-like cupin family protein